MSEIVAFTFYGVAVPKKRPRVTMVGGYARAYTPKVTAAFEGKVRAVAFEAMLRAGADVCPDAVLVELAFDRAMPRSWSLKKKLAMRGEPVASGADIDNQCKAILDALNGVVWEDDRQVSDLRVSRRWADEDAFRMRVSLATGPGELAEVA